MPFSITSRRRLTCEGVKGSAEGDAEKVMERKPSDDEPFAGLAFKVMADPFVGSLTFVRVYSGVMESGSYVYNSVKGKKNASVV